MRILVPVDGSLTSRLMIRFLGSRKTLMAEKPTIELLNVRDPVPESIIARHGIENVEATLLAAGEKVFEDLDPEIAAAGLECERVVFYGEFGITIAKEAEDEHADLIVMGARGLSPMKSLFLGSVSNSVLEHSHTPLLLVHSEAAANLPDDLRVVLAVDGSYYGVAAAKFIAEHSKLFGANPSVTVVNCTPDNCRLENDESLDFSSPEHMSLNPSAEEQLFMSAVEPAVRIIREAGIKVCAKPLCGNPKVRIPQWAREHADLIVMGSHGYGHFKACVLGSTAMHVGAKTDLPLLIIRLPD